MLMPQPLPALFFFFNDPATPEIYTLSLHDALPISTMVLTDASVVLSMDAPASTVTFSVMAPTTMLKFMEIVSARCSVTDRKSTRLNSSHLVISNAVFCLKKRHTIHLHRPRRFRPAR